MSKSRNHRITVTSGMSGYFAVEIAEYQEEYNGEKFWDTDIVQTGIGRYRTSQEAESEAKCWAESENIPYV